MPAFYKNTIDGFLKDSAPNIIGTLTSCYGDAGFQQFFLKATEAWEKQVEILQLVLSDFYNRNGYILFEYPIPRRSKRVDTVLLINDLIIVIEFKCNASYHTADAIAQLEDYCLDLRDFHKESRKKRIIPILVSTEAPPIPHQLSLLVDQVTPVVKANAHDLASILKAVIETYGNQSEASPHTWDESDYLPTPTIIETAQKLYSRQDVHEITRSHAGAENLTITSNFVLQAIEQARTNKEKIICFITGVPGAGKTLAGLNIVHSPGLDEGHATFLSGNIPLVQVLTEALARDEKTRTKQPIQKLRQKIETFIQTTQNFLKEYYNSSKTPPEHIVIFDEAQRAWNKEQVIRKKYKSSISQPQMMLEIMDRHSDWAVVVALIGGGQEINTGEAGLSEWGRALGENYPHWKVFISKELKEGHHSTGGQCLFPEGIPSQIQTQESDHLHLKVSLRSYKAERVSDFIEQFLANNPEQASFILQNDLQNFPIVYTRSLVTAKEWLKINQRGTRRIGLVASSGACRLKPYGLNVKNKLESHIWLLSPPQDIRSSNFLEDPATEFAIQGLELDWVGVCWGGDFIHTKNAWYYRDFSGTKWQKTGSAERKQFILNKYRVLLSRAREGIIIWIPEGAEEDPTRDPNLYNDMAAYLDKIGITKIEDIRDEKVAFALISNTSFDLSAT